ncbi:hypothetical protein KAS08_05745, partial [Candidatus Pacearchaeota archaeon]|nr:hypothetical protein [Candidatus Pacearchaeota archaeon]
DDKWLLYVEEVVTAPALFTQDVYTYLVTVIDDASNTNSTEERTITILSNVPPSDPVVNLVSVGGENETNDDLNCSAVISDADGDTMNVTVRWYKDGALNSSVSYNNNYVNNSEFSVLLDSDNTMKHENWSCELRVHDSEDSSNWSMSNNLTIINILPTVTLDFPSDDASISDRAPNFNWTSIDIDGDSLTYEINITPYDGDNPSVLDERSASGINDLNYTPVTDLKLLYDNGYHYRWKVRANDGDGDGDWSEIWRVNITALVGITLLDDEILFGNLGIGDSNSTEGTGLSPFVVENNGTVVVNVSVNASALWDSVTVDSDKYQFKADEVNTKPNSFNWIGSITNWFNMPLTGFVVGIDKLNYSDAEDSAEIDINLTVPDDEDPGQKSSNIVLLAELAE